MTFLVGFSHARILKSFGLEEKHLSVVTQPSVEQLLCNLATCLGCPSVVVMPSIAY